MKQNPKLLSTAKEIEDLAAALRDPKNNNVIAFDTEFIRENTFFPIVEIIQIATEEESWLVDAQAFKKSFRPGPAGGFDPGLKPLLEVFEDPKILKILHAAQGDQECLFTSFASVATPTLDTAVAASLCGYGESIGLGKLLHACLGITIKKGHARTNWSVRPLPEQLMEYAHADVIHLVALGRKLMEELDSLGRKPWALHLSSRWSDCSAFEADISAMAQKYARGKRLDARGYSALINLLRWREDRVRHLNVPRRWVADDNVLLDLAHVRPKDIDHLSSFRGINRGELRISGDAILAAIQNLKANDAQIDSDWKAFVLSSQSEIPSQDESQALELLKCYVGILADEHRIALRHLVTSEYLLRLIRNQALKPEDLVSSGVLTEDSAQLIGTELLAFLQGEYALRVDGARIRIVKVK
ncbi:HRDC domain-containing protein [Bdellovibrionota bacterium FG-2]